MKDLKLSEIWTYPVKSLGGIPLQSSIVREKGLPYDRRWMLVDENGIFLTQRVNPTMALFKTILNGRDISIRYQNDSIDLPSAPRTTQQQSVTIWNDTVMAYEVSPQHSQWFSDRLGFRCRLVHFPEENPRPVDPAYKVNDEHVSLADAYPFLIIGQGSLDDLNTRLEKGVPMNRFRPNFVFTGGEPFEEDTWRNFTIGSNRFVAVKPCARCVLTTVNQDTGEKGAEPLPTLSRYRTRNNKVYFGQNLVALDHGEIKVGDTVTIGSYQ